MLADVSLALLATFIIIVVMLLAYVNEEGEASHIDQWSELIFKIGWKDPQVDVDLWYKGPEGNTVSYSNKNTEYADLQRDDLGQYESQICGYCEHIAVHDMTDGEHIFNIHFYSNRGGHDGVDVAWEFERRTEAQGSATKFRGTTTLSNTNQEKTLISLYIKDGKIQHKTVMRDRYKPLRNRGSKP